MTDTPRTDDRASWAGDMGVEVVHATFARQLETELAEAQAEIEKLKGVVISQITPEPLVLSHYSTTAEPAKDESGQCEDRKDEKEMNDAMKHDTDRWPEEARLDMIEKSEWYENPKNYQYGYYDGYQRARAEMLANARLIAAAPAMYEALKACAEFIHYYDQEHNIGDGKVLEQAIAALRAADGGE